MRKKLAMLGWILPIAGAALYTVSTALSKTRTSDIIFVIIILFGFSLSG